jgi:hypothetical protein
MNAKIVGTLMISGVLLGASAVGMAAPGASGSSPSGSTAQSRDHGSMMGMGGMMGVPNDGRNERHGPKNRDAHARRDDARD